MISLPNMQSLIENNLSYIVGARMANLKLDQIRKISHKLNQTDNETCRIETERGLLFGSLTLKLLELRLRRY